MLPFLKNQQEASVSGDEDQPDSYKHIDALVDDWHEVLNSKDKARLKQALEALCDYIAVKDEEQDKNLEHKE